MANVKILVCCHKKDVCATRDPYIPIHVGKKNTTVSLGIQEDDTGDNISEKNANYAELTGIYWAWKNIKEADVIGLCHYRRYFDFHNQCKQGFPYTLFGIDDFKDIDLSIPDKYINHVMKGKVIVAAPMHSYQPIYMEYCRNHRSEDYRLLTKIVYETQPSYIIDAYHEVMLSNKLSPFNMFIMSRIDFDNYCNWLFELFNKVEENINLSHYNPDQSRVFGYMGERLLNVWIKAQSKSIIEKPVIIISNSPKPRKHRFLYQIRNLLWDGINVIDRFSLRIASLPEY